MNIDLANKTALVCGASQGMGLATAKELALLGATVIIASRSVDKLKDALSQLATTAHQKHAYLVMDLSKPAESATVLQQLINKGTTIHILVNNAGGPLSGPMIETTATDLETAFKTHLVSSRIVHCAYELSFIGNNQAVFSQKSAHFLVIYHKSHHACIRCTGATTACTTIVRAVMRVVGTT